jgi:polyisoprenoid-binding protein YceI
MRVESMLAAVFLSVAPSFPAVAGTSAWQIDVDASVVTFAYLENDRRRAGHFREINPQIDFDPDNLAETRGMIEVSIASLTLGDPMREGILVTEPWLDAGNHPNATFKVDRIEPGSIPDHATAIGSLEIKGISLPLSVPVVISRQADSATASGALRFDRIDYGLRDVFVESLVSIDNEIVLDFELVAHRR